MPLRDGEYQKLTKEEIQQRLEQSLEAQLDTTANPGDLVTKQLKAEAEVLAQNQEEALQRVHQAAYLADATGEELDKVVDIIGLERSEATSATGVVRLWRDTPPTTTYTIPRGKSVQSGDLEPIEFDITQRHRLAHIDGFESNDLNNWEGDKSSFSIRNTTKLTGNYALEVPATSGVQLTTVAEDFKIGTTFNADVYPNTDSVTAVRFGLQDQSNYFECVVNESAQDLKLRLVEGGAEVALSGNNTATIPADESSHIEIEWGLYQDTTATLYETSSRDTELCSVSLSESREWEDGAVSVASLDGTAICLVDEVATRSVMMNVEAVDSGAKTNLGPNTVNTIADPITGVEDVTNPIATGSQNFSDNTFTSLTLGEERESDEDLRERAFNSTSIGGAATVNALGTELRRVKGVNALTLNRNREETTVDGMPPHSFEAVVYGGSDKDIAETIFNTASIDSHDVGGVNGTEVTYDITSEVTDDTETISWSRPYTLDLAIDLTLVVDDTYVGDEKIRSIVTNYIGGTGLDGNFVTGLDVGDDVYEAVLKHEIVDPDEHGVWEVDSLVIDKDGDGTDDTTTTTSGADVLPVASNEVAEANARDGSISITTNKK